MHLFRRENQVIKVVGSSADQNLGFTITFSESMFKFDDPNQDQLEHQLKVLLKVGVIMPSDVSVNLNMKTQIIKYQRLLFTL